MASTFQKKITAWVRDCEDYIRSRDDAEGHSFCFYSNFFAPKTAESTQAILSAASNSTTIWREDGRYLLLTYGTSMISDAPTGPTPVDEKDCDVYVAFSKKGSPSVTNHPLRLAPTTALIQPAAGMTRRFTATPKADAVTDTRGKVESVVNKVRADSLFAATSPAVAAISGLETGATQTSLVQAVNEAQEHSPAPTAQPASPTTEVSEQPERARGTVARASEVTSALKASDLQDRGAKSRAATRADFKNQVHFEIEGEVGQLIRAAGHKMLKRRDIAPRRAAVSPSDKVLHFTRESHDVVAVSNFADCVAQPHGRLKLVAKMAEHNGDLTVTNPHSAHDAASGGSIARSGEYTLNTHNANDTISVSKD